MPIIPALASSDRAQGSCEMDQAALRRSWAWTIAPWVAFVCMVGWVASRHELWHDELQVFGLARESKSAAEVIANIRYDSTPPLWHLGVYAVSQVSNHPRSMQVLHVVVAALAAAVFLRYAPFTKLQQILFIFGYFPFIEYGVISRSYVSGELFLFTFLAAFPWTRGRAVLAGASIFLMAQSSFFGAVMAGASAVAWFAYARRRVAFDSGDGRWTIGGLAIAAAGLIIAATFVRQHPDAAAHRHWDFINFWQALRAGTIPWRTLVPIPAWRSEFWNTNFLDTFPSLDYSRDPFGFLLQCALSVALLAMIVWFLRKQPIALGFYLLITLSCLAFFYTKKLGYLRHHGHLYLAFIGAAWMSSIFESVPGDSDPTAGFKRGRGARFLTTILALNVIATLVASVIECQGQFAADEAAAEWIVKNGYQDHLLVTGPGVAALLDRDVYLMRNQRFGRFYYYREPWANPDPADFAALADRLERESGKPTLFVLPTDPETNFRDDAPVKGFRRLTAWKNSLLPHDNIVILDRERPAAAPPPPAH